MADFTLINFEGDGPATNFYPWALHKTGCSDIKRVMKAWGGGHTVRYNGEKYNTAKDVTDEWFDGELTEMGWNADEHIQIHNCAKQIGKELKAKTAKTAKPKAKPKTAKKSNAGEVKRLLDELKTFQDQARKIRKRLRALGHKGGTR